MMKKHVCRTHKQEDQKGDTLHLQKEDSEAQNAYAEEE